MTGRALEAVLDQLHGLVADALIKELKHHAEQLALNPQRVLDHQAEMLAYEDLLEVWEAGDRKPEDKPKEPKALMLYQVPPQFLDKVLKFLAQNGVNAPATAPKVDALAHELRDLNLDDIARPHH